MTTFQPDVHDTRAEKDEDKRCKNCGTLFHDHHNSECPSLDSPNYAIAVAYAKSRGVTDKMIAAIKGGDNRPEHDTKYEVAY